MKKTLLVLGLLLGITQLQAQQGLPPTYESGSGSGEGFQTNNIFIGGSLSLGFGSNYFNIGGNPEIGYSFSEWIDAGLAFNINYTSNKWNYTGGGDIKQNTFNYGGGVFTRLYPIRNLFVQLQPEYNWSSTTYKTPGYADEKYTTSAPSLLAGIGYGQRIIGQSSYYIALLFDVNKDKNSPYRNYDGSFIPILRAGFNFYLHQNR
ncbi:hypothetical protein [Filimonas effusa]|uniref:Outer membrane protein beta-barrel domain-containing protein n=1 Tax=Filimonas effusa TaxID=2508721 RepID=A0A4Q1D353_9BACT|nr:hypothetical protein [Filimonas effusa]RXK82830.1 hypothetical protein ESB13_11880 [Filimonas effusa]